MKLPLFITIGLALAGVGYSQSYQVTVDSQDRGWVTPTAFGAVGNYNFIAGNFNSTEYRNFFVFDLSNVEGEIVSASLSLIAPPSLSYSSGNAVEIFALNLLNSTIPADRNNAQAGSVFNAIANNQLLSYTSVSASSGSMTFDFNSSGALLALNNAAGGTFSLGGQVLSLDSNSSTVEYVFGNSHVNPGGTNPMVLNLTVNPIGGAVPEPGTTMMCVFAGGLALLRRRR